MFRKFLAGKIHRARVTDANLEYEGSISIDPEVMGLAGLKEFESVNVWNVTRGTRIETYALCGKKQEYCLNGAAAHKFDIGDVIIISWWAFMPPIQAMFEDPRWIVKTPKIILIDPKTNLIVG